MSYRIHYWTHPGGCTRDETLVFNTFVEVKQDIVKDIVANPYINFWYGQFIDVYQDERRIVRLDTNSHECPITFKLYFDNYMFTSLNAIPEIDDEFDLAEYIADALFANESECTINDDDSSITLTFADQHNLSMLVTLKIEPV